MADSPFNAALVLAAFDDYPDVVAKSGYGYYDIGPGRIGQDDKNVVSDEIAKLPESDPLRIRWQRIKPLSRDCEWEGEDEDELVDDDAARKLRTHCDEFRAMLKESSSAANIVAANGQGPVDAGAESENWPPDDGWHVRDGLAAYLGVRFSIHGIPAKLLYTLFNARFPCGEMTLIDSAEMAGDKRALKSHLTKCRAILRKAFHLAEDADPIPSKGRGADVIWEIDRELLKRSVESLNEDSTEN